MDTREKINLSRKELSEKEINEYLNESPEIKEAFSQGFSLGYARFYYMAGILDAKGLTNCLEQIEPGLEQRLWHKIPDNPQKHPEIRQLLLKETRDYIERWEMYNNLFRDAA